MGDVIKIPILGLDNAGKTSLILTLRKEFDKLANIEPTKKIERVKLDLFNKNIVVWDFGGQKKYREKYAKKADVYFSDMGPEAFYVVDIQDPSKFQESVAYFKDIVDAIKKYNDDCTINLLIHKLDPGLEKDKDILERFEDLSVQFIDISHPLRLRVAQTSIYNPISVIRAFSKPLFGNTTIYSNLSILFKDFVEQSDAFFAILFNKQLMELGNYFDPEVPQEVIKDISNELLASLNEKGLSTEKLKGLAVGPDKKYMINAMEIKSASEPYFMVYGYDKDGDPMQISTKAMNTAGEVEVLLKFI